MIDSGYQLAYLPGGQLQVSSTPSYVLCLVTALVGIVPSYVFVRTMLRTRTMFPLWGFVVWTLPWILVSLVWLRTGGLTLDKAADTATLRKQVFFSHRDTVVPLHLVRYAEIRSLRASSYIAVILESGEALTFADSDGEGGKGQAVESINRYIGTTVR